jgi:hypothetical protein
MIPDTMLVEAFLNRSGLVISEKTYLYPVVKCFGKLNAQSEAGGGGSIPD